MPDDPSRTPLLVRGAGVAGTGGLRAADVLVDGGQIVAVEPPGTVEAPAGAGARAEIVDAGGAWLLPGAIDAHVHAGAPFCDDLPAVAAGAARAGVTTLGVYAYPEPFDDPLAAAARLAGWAAGNDTDVVVHWRLHKEAPVDAQVAAATAVGITSFKVFMSYRARGLMWTDDEIGRAMEGVARAGGVMAVHAECGERIAARDDELAANAAGLDEIDAFLAARPADTESEAVTRALALGRATGCAVLIPHLSSAAGLDAYRAAREVSTSLETCPQYVELTATAMREHGAAAKIGPPLRERADCDALAAAVEAGEVDVVGSDHAPYTPAQKDVPFGGAPYGMPGVETLLPLVLDRFGPVVAARVCGEGPACAIGLAGRKGAVAPGHDADLVLVDPAATTTVRAAGLVSGARWTPYEGRALRGAVVATWLRGERVGDREPGGPGRGRHLERTADAGRRQ